MPLLPRTADFIDGQTLRKRVPAGGRMYRRISGYDNSLGPLIPDKYPSQVSTTGLGTIGEQVPLAFRDGDGLRIVARDADGKIRVMSTTGVWGSAGPEFEIIPDSTPFKIGALAVFPTPSGIMAYELDSDTWRPFSFKGPENYDEAYEITVTPSPITCLQLFDIHTGSTIVKNTTDTNEHGNTFGSGLSQTLYDNKVSFENGYGGPDEHPPPNAWMWRYVYPTDCILTLNATPTAGGSGYTAGDILTLTEGTGGKAVVYSVDSSGAVTVAWLIAGGRGYTTGTGKVTSGGTGTGCTLNITALGGVDLAGKQFLVLDMSMEFSGMDPNYYAIKSGEFINNPELRSSPYVIELCANGDGSGEIARYSIPLVETNGKIHRIVINLGDISSTVVRSFRIRSASHWPHGPVEGTGWNLYMYSGDFADDWKFLGNQSMTEVKFSHSPWCDIIPTTSPGTKTAGTVSPTAADVLETFPQNMSQFTPDHPIVRWYMVYRGRSYLSDEEYDQMLSNPTFRSDERFSDPWRVYHMSWVFPTSGSPPVDVIDEYGEYATHVLLYREQYRGLGFDEIVDVLGVWDPPEYVGKRRIGVACTFTASTDIITSTAHGLIDGETVQFVQTTGGVTKGSVYYVISATTDTFQISTILGGSPVNLTADVNNTWSHAGYDDMGRIDYPCTMAAATDNVTSLMHRLHVGDIITFGSSNVSGSAGVVRYTLYYVVSVIDYQTFKISDREDGSPIQLVDDSDNTWSSAGHVMTIDDHTIPDNMEINHDYADDAKYAIVADSRIYAGHLTFVEDTPGEWTRPLVMMVSNMGDYSSFPASVRTSVDPTISSQYQAIDGQELSKFSPDSYEIRGLLVKNDVKYAFTEKGFWELVGDSAGTPWAFLRRDTIGLKSAKTLADCRSQIIWHGPAGGTDKGSYFYSYAGGLAVPISKGLVESSYIDWTKAHQGVFSNERYVFFCYYNDPNETAKWSLWVYNLEHPGWRSAHSSAFEYVGMCVDDATGDVYALTHDGYVVNVFGQLDIFGDTEAVRKVEWQFAVVAEPNETRTTEEVVADIITEEDSIQMELQVSSQGTSDRTKAVQYKTVTKEVTQYRWPIGVTGDAVMVSLVYRGATPPEIHDLRIRVPEATAT